MSLSHDEIHRRLPTLALIDDPDVREETADLAARAPSYFWEVPASRSTYHHPLCRGRHGLWIHTLQLSTVIERLADSVVGRGELSPLEIDLARAAAILHDMRKNGPPSDAADSSVSDHDLRMASEIRTESELDERVADAVASHMGPWYDGPTPSTPLEELVHTADMIASTATIAVSIQGPIPTELRDLDELEEVDLR